MGGGYFSKNLGVRHEAREGGGTPAKGHQEPKTPNQYMEIDMSIDGKRNPNFHQYYVVFKYQFMIPREVPLASVLCGYEWAVVGFEWGQMLAGWVGSIHAQPRLSLFIPLQMLLFPISLIVPFSSPSGFKQISPIIKIIMLPAVTRSATPAHPCNATPYILATLLP